MNMEHIDLSSPPKLPQSHDAQMDDTLIDGSEIFREHPDLLRETLEAGVLEDATDGTSNGICWHRTDRLGKHQRVALVDYDTPDRQPVSVAIRQSYGQYREMLETYPQVQQFYPAVYDSLPVSSDDPHLQPSEMLAIEKVEGPHGDLPDPAVVEKYQEIIRSPEGFEQLCTDMFEAIDTILSLPLDITDVKPAAGHNVIFNTQTGHFQFFDIDTIRKSDKPHVEKFLNFVNNAVTQRGNNDQALSFALRMLQMYQAAYPDQELRFDHAPGTFEFYGLSDGKDDQQAEIIGPDVDGELSEEYFTAYDIYLQQNGHEAIPIASKPKIRKTTKQGHYSFILRPDIREAVHNNDIRGLEAALGATEFNQNKMLNRTFVKA